MLVFNIATSPVYAQSWNLQRSGSNLNFYFSGAGANALQLTSGGNGTFTGNITGTNITLTPSNPNITSGGSYVTIPNGLYISGGTFYAQNQLQARGGVNNDGGTLSLTASNGVVSVPQKLSIAGTELSPENAFYLKQIGSQSGYTGTRFYLGNGTSSGYVYGDGSGFGLLHSGGGWALRIAPGESGVRSSWFQDSENASYYLDPGGTSPLNVLQPNQLNSAGQVQTNEWFRINGPQGIYWNSYGGGWYMSDSTYLRSYATKPVLAPYYADQDNPGYFMDPASTSRLGPITQAYGSYIFPGDVSGGLGSFQASYYLASSSYWGLYTNTGFSANDLYSRVDTYARYGGGTYQTKIGYIAQTAQGGIETGGHMTLHTTGGGNIYYFTDTSQSNIFRSDGNIWMAWCGCYTSNFSDGRLKKDIRPISSALDKIMDLKGVYFKFDKTVSPKKTEGYPDTLQLGFIAQDVQKVVPEVINTSEDGYLSIDYSRLTALLAEGIKTLNDKITGIDKRLDQKDEEIKSLQEQVTQLKKSVEDLKNQSGTDTVDKKI